MPGKHLSYYEKHGGETGAAQKGGDVLIEQRALRRYVLLLLDGGEDDII
jgi:hypothetical protein